MKTILLAYLISLSSLFPLSAQAGAESIFNEITSSLNDICGDSWCEGDYQFNFYRLECDYENQFCMLDIDLIDTDHEDQDIYDKMLQFYGYDKVSDNDQPALEYSRICIIPDVKNFSDIAEKETTALQYRGLKYTHKLYEDVSMCIDKMYEIHRERLNSIL